MSRKTKAIEIVKNLIQTMSHMDTKAPIEGMNGLNEAIRPKKSALRKIKRELIKKYNLNERDYAITEEEN